MSFFSKYNLGNNSFTSIVTDGHVIVNGRHIKVPKNASISVQNDKVYVNGKLYNEDSELNETLENSKEIKVVIQDSTIKSLDMESCEAKINNCNIDYLNIGNCSTITANDTNIKRKIDMGNSCSLTVANVEGDIDCGNMCTINVKGEVKGNIDTGNMCTINK